MTFLFVVLITIHSYYNSNFCLSLLLYKLIVYCYKVASKEASFLELLPGLDVIILHSYFYLFYVQVIQIREDTIKYPCLSEKLTSNAVQPMSVKVQAQHSGFTSLDVLLLSHKMDCI